MVLIRMQLGPSLRLPGSALLNLHHPCRILDMVMARANMAAAMAEDRGWVLRLSLRR